MTLNLATDNTRSYFDVAHKGICDTRLRARRILKRIRKIALWVLLPAVIFMTEYLETRTIFSAFIHMIGFFAAVFIGAVVSAASTTTAKSLGKKTRQAKCDELKREDDVLLQAVAFSQSVLFVYLSLIDGSDVITGFKIIVPIVAVLFYALRAWGKITDNAKYRYWSIWLLLAIILNTIFALAYAWIGTFIVFENTEVPTYITFLLYLTIVYGSLRFVEEIFKKRYGYQ